MIFTKYFYIQQIEILAYHRSYNKILGKHHVADVRYKAFDISTWSDYAKLFSFDPNGQIQNELFDNNRTLSIEGCCLYTVNISSFMTLVVVTFTNLMARYGSSIYIYMIQRCKMSLQLKLISIQYWIGCLRRKKL